MSSAAVTLTNHGLVNMTGGDHPFHLHGFFFQVLETITKDADGNIIEVTPAPQLEDKEIVNLPHRPGARGSTTTVKVAARLPL
jgi:FtsP/CotA-like multicopper oxidase with cupredoxin domain